MTTQTVPAQQNALILTDADLPEIFRTADSGAKSSQRWHFFFVRFELIFISLAAVAEVFGRPIAPVIVSLFNLHVGEVTLLGRHYTSEEVTTLLASNITAGVFMVLAIGMFVLRFSLRRDHRWRGRRALAEATKGLAWRYGMRAMHADLQASGLLNEEQSHEAFLKELGQIEQEGYDLHLASPKPNDVQLTYKMEKLRAASLVAQKDTYMEGRLKDQQEWYANKAGKYETWTNILQWARGITYVVGVFLIIFNPFGSTGLSAMTTIAGAFATWLAGRHYDDLSQSYGAMARKLIGLKNLAPNLSAANPGGVEDPQTALSTFVNDVETLMDGEHRDWLRNI